MKYRTLVVSFVIVVFVCWTADVIKKISKLTPKHELTDQTILTMIRPFRDLKIDDHRGSEVPKLIHHTYWSESALKPQQRKLMKTWEQSQWQHVFWSDEDCRRLVKESVPWFYNTYNSYPYNVQRSDVARIVILRAVGGIYIDTDYELLQPSSLINISSANCSVNLMEGPTVDVDGLFQNTFMVSDRSEIAIEFWTTALRKAKSLLDESYWKTQFGFHGTGTVMMITGPGLLTQSYSIFRGIGTRLDSCFGVFHNFDGTKLLQLFESALPKNSSSDICSLPSSLYSGQGSRDRQSLVALHHNTRSWIRSVHIRTHFIPRVVPGALALFIPVLFSRVFAVSYRSFGILLSIPVCYLADFPSPHLPSELVYAVVFMTYWSRRLA